MSIGSVYYTHEDSHVQKTAMIMFNNHFWAGSKGSGDIFAAYDELNEEFVVTSIDAAYERVAKSIHDHAPVELSVGEIEQTLRMNNFLSPKRQNQAEQFMGENKQAYLELAKKLLQVES